MAEKLLELKNVSKVFRIGGTHRARHNPLIHLVRGLDDAAAVALTKNFCKPGYRNFTAGNQIVQHRPGPHGRELVGISDQNYRCAWPHCPEKRYRKRQIQHRNLIQHKQLIGKRFPPVVHKLTGYRIPFEQTVQGKRADAGGFTHPFGCPSGWCGK